MTIKDWQAKSKSRIEEYGFKGAYWSIREGFLDLARRVGDNVSFGTNIYEYDWDLLVLLDGCRTDSLTSALGQGDYDFSYEWDTLWSRGSQSVEWMQNTFVQKYEEEISNTAYITANPYSNNVLDKDDFALLDEVWGYGHDPEIETIPPRPVTERAISAGRNNDFGRVIVHYMQPHYPFIGDDSTISRGFDPDKGISDKNNGVLNMDVWWNKLKYNEINREQIWDSYMKNLNYVLDDVDILLNNFDAVNAVISADHGNSFGELGAYGHPSGLLHPYIRRVPWVRTSGVDNSEYIPNSDNPPEQSVKTDNEELLSDLGYL